MLSKQICTSGNRYAICIGAVRHTGGRSMKKILNGRSLLGKTLHVLSRAVHAVAAPAGLLLWALGTLAGRTARRLLQQLSGALDGAGQAAWA